MVYLEDQYLGMPKILTKCKSIVLLHVTTDVLLYLNDIMNVHPRAWCIYIR